MHITTRSDRSTASTLLYNLILRPLAPQLRKVNPNTETEGSPRLDLPKSLTKKCETHERQVANIWVYDIVIKRSTDPSDTRPDIEAARTTNSTPTQTNNATRKTKRIYYFAGGSWQSPPDDGAYRFLIAVAEKLTQPAIITLVSAPLAPRNPATKAFPMLVDFYDALTRDPGWRDGEEEICFAGDSSGGNIVLALVMWCVRREFERLEKEGLSNGGRGVGQGSDVEGVQGGELSSTSLADPKMKAPSSLLLISPTVDLTHSDPSLPEVSKKDPIETLDFVRSTAAAWSAASPDTPAWSLTDPRLSPIYGHVPDLAAAGVHVYGVIGGADVLGPEALTFARKCEEAGVPGRFLVWERQMHNFPMTAPYGVIPEGKEGLEWVVHALDVGGSRGDEVEEGWKRVEGTGHRDVEDEKKKKSRRESVGEAKDKVKGEVKREWSRYHPAP